VLVLSGPVALLPGPAPFAPAGRRRSDIRVMASMRATASAMRPTTCAVTTGMPSGSRETLGSAFALPARLPAPGAGLGESDGLICGNKPDALPGAPMSELASLFRAGSGPTGILDPLPSPLPPPRPLPLPTVDVWLLLLDDEDEDDEDAPGPVT